MDKSAIDQNVLRRAEAFVDKVVTPRLAQTPREDPRTLRARADMARDDSDSARHVLQAGGLDLDRLDALAADRSKARRERLEQARQRAIAGSAEAGRRLTGLAPALPPADPPTTITIDQVTFIRSFADAGTVYDSAVTPLDSWAKYGFDAPGDDLNKSGLGRLSFFTLWQNPMNQSIILAAGAQLVVNARLEVDADGFGVSSWFGVNGTSRATVRAQTTVWGMDSSVSSIVADQILASASADGGFWGGDDSASITFDQLLGASGVSVAAQAWSLIEVSLLTDWYAFFGEVHLDAHNGSFKVSVPGLILTVS